MSPAIYGPLLPVQDAVPAKVSLADALRRDNDKDTRQVARDAILDFIRRAHIAPSPWTVDPTGLIEKRLTEEVSSWPFVDLAQPQYRKPLKAGVCIATTVFAHTALDTQAHIAVYAFLVICLDDTDLELPALAQFGARFYAGRPQLHPLLDRLVAHLGRMPAFYTEYAATAIMAGTVQFVNTTYVERLHRGVPLARGALAYVRFKRSRNGIAEGFSLFAWEKSRFPDVTPYIQIIPETSTFLDFTNDILSFYKEELAGETENFVHDCMAATGEPASRVLGGLVDEVVGAVARARELLAAAGAGADAERAVLEHLLSGYVAFHLVSPRYRLDDLGDAGLWAPPVRA